MTKHILSVFILSSVFASHFCEAGLKVYYLRHGQVGTNVQKELEGKPREEWPAYVGNPEMFTPQGEKQVARVAEKLAPYKFDLVACSPVWRARQTILPYLRENGVKAEIWPALTEFDFPQYEGELPAPSDQLFTGGKPVEIPAEEAAYFQALDDATLARIDTSSAAQARADIKALMDHLRDRIHKRFGGTDKTILLVGHALNSSQLLPALTGAESPGWAENTALWMAEEQPDGSFKVLLFNDKPVP